MPLSAIESYAAISRTNHKINLTRGRPAPEFLDLAAGLESTLPNPLLWNDSDLRNYNGFPGLPAARQLGADLLNVPAERVLIGGNSSLTLLSWVLTMAWLKGVNGQPAWRNRDNTACLCPVPGYDRHFFLFDLFGIAMPTVRLNGEGADMDALEAILASNPSLRAVILVPRHSNPSGDVWSPQALTRLMRAVASLPRDFLIFCDNAYAIHDFLPTPDTPNIYALAEKEGVADRLFLLGSTSKLGYAGSGLSFVAASPDNLAALQKTLTAISLGADPLSQARHVLFFRNAGGMKEHFARIAPLLKARFDIAATELAPLTELPGVQISRPTGGYFLSMDLPAGTAKRTVELAAALGVSLSAAGSTFPGGHDPLDSHLRLAPTSPDLHQLEPAMQVVCASARLAIAEAQTKSEK